ncbi:hypothetical protein DFJ77DRAFT_467184 [Powellomyces hirtus]|nr:hypothetical protein DFJ77DRAFT_467184 [Powellomyces hirtus]
MLSSRGNTSTTPLSASTSSTSLRKTQPPFPLVRSKSFLSRETSCDNALDLSYGKGQRPFSAAFIAASQRDEPRVNNVYLQRNDLQQLPDELRLMVNTTYLDVSFNSLASFPETLFHALPELRFLAAQDNALKSVPATLAECSRLEHLMLFKNWIEHIPDDLFEFLPELRTLDLAVNELCELPQQLFLHCVKLRELFLRKNRLRIISPKIGNLVHLTRLILSENALETIPQEIRHLARLQVLDLSCNKISLIPSEAFEGLLVLEHLALNGNEILNLSGTCFSGLSALRILNLEQNPLSALPAAIGTLPSLEELWIDIDDDSPIISPPLAICRRGLDVVKLHLRENVKSGKDVGCWSIHGFQDGDQLAVAFERSFTIQCRETDMQFISASKTASAGVMLPTVLMEELDGSGVPARSYPLHPSPVSEDGSFTVVYSARQKGARRIQCCIAGDEISGSGATVILLPRPVSLEHCICQGDALEKGTAGAITTFKILPRDEFGNLSTTFPEKKPPVWRIHLTRAAAGMKKSGSSLHDNSRASVRTTSAAASETFKWAVTPNEDGSYTGHYSTTLAGLYRLRVTLNDTPLSILTANTTSAIVCVSPGPTAASRSTASLNTEFRTVVGERMAFTVRARDRFANDRREGGDHVLATLRNANGTVEDCTVVDTADGQYTVSCTPRTPGISQLEVRIRASAQESISGHRDIHGSPISLNVLPAPRSRSDYDNAAATITHLEMELVRVNKLCTDLNQQLHLHTAGAISRVAGTNTVAARLGAGRQAVDDVGAYLSMNDTI